MAGMDVAAPTKPPPGRSLLVGRERKPTTRLGVVGVDLHLQRRPGPRQAQPRCAQQADLAVHPVP